MNDVIQMAGPIDAAECGLYSCSLYMYNTGIQFIVNGLGTHEIGWMAVGAVYQIDNRERPVLTVRRESQYGFTVRTV